MSKLFEEAIADAKKLKEVAEETAKKAILESVTPKMREYIEEQLLENPNDDMTEEEDFAAEEKTLEYDEIKLDENSLKALSKLLTGKSNSSEIKEAFDRLLINDKTILGIITIKDKTDSNNFRREI